MADKLQIYSDGFRRWKERYLAERRLGIDADTPRITLLSRFQRWAIFNAVPRVRKLTRRYKYFTARFRDSRISKDEI